MSTRKRFIRHKETVCYVPGCQNLAVSAGRCQQHRGMAGMTTSQATSKRFLSSTAWLELRAKKIAECPWCEYCAAAGRGEFIPAIDVDHVLPRHSHPELALVESNLRSACKACHAQKTARGE